MDGNKVLFRAVGDIRVDREDPDSLMNLVAPTLKNSDLMFGQLESSYSTRGQIAINLTPGFRADPRNITGIANAGVKVMSVASNHSADYGHDAFLDTIDNLKKNGIAVIGGGKNITEARTPGIFDIKGNKIALLAYNAILQPGYEARANKPGMPPLRVKTFYEQLDWQPGTPAKVWTIADPDDVAAILEDVKKAKANADLVFVNIHWGVHYMVGHLAMYQLDVGHKVIDAGADVLLGHHAHNLGPIEFYKGRPIFYSLGNFAFDYRTPEEYPDDPFIKAQNELYKLHTDSKYSVTQFPVVSRAEVIVNFTIANKKIERTAFLPVMANIKGQPEIVKPGSEEGKQVIALQTELAKNYNTQLTVDGEEVVLSAVK
jgi:poly-gamma-glutamate synthesis protein (capsule biosynthesis protein)